jgi:hypothetical protein
MFRAIREAVSDEMSALKTRVMRLVLGIVLAGAALIVLLVAAARALFIWVALQYGPLMGHLAVAGAALVIALIGLVIAMPGRRQHKSVTQTAANQVRSATDQAFDSARALGERVSATATGTSDALHSRQGLLNAVLAAAVIGMILGRRT